MGYVSVNSHSIEACDLLSTTGRFWYLRLERKSPLKGKLDTFWEVWGRGDKIALFRNGEVGCECAPGYATNWAYVRKHVQNFLTMGYKVNKEAIKKIDTQQLQEIFEAHQPQLSPLYPSVAYGDDGEEPPEPKEEEPTQRSIKDLEKSRQRKADW